jgi:diaminohydroxyphosphoribosylaminopyrimidine deaminase/5-amino-6-(5-phosphoribosylamino)uracil reductase
MSGPHPETVSDREARRFLDMAARAALRAFGDAEPNPLVGCVLVKDERVIGIGHHRVFGGPHAEREALANAAARGEDAAGCTAFVTLEPCCHHGKQPPCTDALLAARVARVVYAAADPNPPAAGGAGVLQRAGVAAEFSAASELASGLSVPFVHRLRTGRPWVIAKWAQTIDGRIATRDNESQWISGPLARRRVHRLRARVDAVLTGIGTVRSDDPMLNPRGVGRVRREAARVVVDSHLAIDPACKLVATARSHRTIVAATADAIDADPDRAERLRAAGVRVLATPSFGLRVDARALLEALARDHGVATVLVEAGPTLLGSLLEAELIDEAVVYIAPVVLGDERARASAEGRVAPRLADGRRFQLLRVKVIGGDVELTYRRSPG